VSANYNVRLVERLRLPVSGLPIIAPGSCRQIGRYQQTASDRQAMAWNRRLEAAEKRAHCATRDLLITPRTSAVGIIFLHTCFVTCIRFSASIIERMMQLDEYSVRFKQTQLLLAVKYNC
jgi:hypothetical protein